MVDLVAYSYLGMARLDPAFQKQKRKNPRTIRDCYIVQRGQRLRPETQLEAGLRFTD